MQGGEIHLPAVPEKCYGCNKGSRKESRYEKTVDCRSIGDLFSADRL